MSGPAFPPIPISRMPVIVPTLTMERALWEQGFSRVCGVDEVGRGALCAAVVAAAVILKPGTTEADLAGVRDSKRMTARQREQMDELIRHHALAFAIGAASPGEIDRLNIRRATELAMRRAVSRLGRIDQILLDGTDSFDLGAPVSCVAQGDGRVLSIAAASVLAKVTRDLLLDRLDERYEAYGWASNKGYGSARHRGAIETLGLTPHHRRSFGARPQLMIDLR